MELTEKRSVKSVLANDAYGKKLTKRITDIDEAHAAFKGEPDKLLHWRAKLISHNEVDEHAADQYRSKEGRCEGR